MVEPTRALQWRLAGPRQRLGLTYGAAGNAQAFFGSPIDVSPAVNIVDGEAHTMIMTWESKPVGGDAIARFFVDAEQVGEVETPDERSGITNANGFVIGTDAESASSYCIGSPNNRFFAGAIGELRLYESIEEPRRLHAELLGGPAVTTPTITIDKGTVTVRGLAYSSEPRFEASFRYGTDAELEISTATATAPTNGESDNPPPRAERAARRHFRQHWWHRYGGVRGQRLEDSNARPWSQHVLVDRVYANR